MATFLAKTNVATTELRLADNAIKADGALWRGGRNIGLEPVKILDGVAAAAADQSGSVALLKDGSLWQWQRGETPERHFQCPR